MNQPPISRAIRVVRHLVKSKSARRTVCGWPIALFRDHSVAAAGSDRPGIAYCQDCVLREHGMEPLPR